MKAYLQTFLRLMREDQEFVDQFWGTLSLAVICAVLIKLILGL